MAIIYYLELKNCVNTVIVGNSLFGFRMTK